MTENNLNKRKTFSPPTSFSSCSNLSIRLNEENANNIIKLSRIPIKKNWSDQFLRRRHKLSWAKKQFDEKKIKIERRENKN